MASKIQAGIGVCELSETERQTLEMEFDLFMARHGIEVPADWRAGVLVGFLDLRQMAALLRQPRDESSESSNTFSLPAILRGR